MTNIIPVITEFGFPENTKISKIEVGGMHIREAYLLEKDGVKYILKNFKPSNAVQVGNAAKIMNILSEKGFNKIPQNVKAKSGNFVVEIEGNCWELQKYLEGNLINNSDLNIEQVRNLAIVIADLHNLFLGKTNTLKFNEEISYSKMFDGEQHTRMVDAVEKLRQAGIPTSDLALLEEYWTEYNKSRDEILRKLTHSEEKLQRGLIHRDLNKGNIIFDKNSNQVVGIVDWDTVMWGNILQDLCYVSVTYLTVIQNNTVDTKRSGELIQNFLDSYQTKIKLNNEEKLLFPTIAEILRVRATRWSVKAYGEAFMEKDKSERNLKDYEKMKGNFNKTLRNWIDSTEIIKKIFEEIKL